LEDEIIIRFAGERAEEVKKKLNLNDIEALDHKKVRQLTDHAQKSIEGDNFKQRKTLIQYDDVINEQRKIIYNQRDEVVENQDLKEYTLSMIKEVIENEVESNIIEEEYIEEEFKNLEKNIKAITTIKVNKEELMKMDEEDIKVKIYELVLEIYEEKQEMFEQSWNDIQKNIILKAVDTNWIDHIENMDNLKQYIGYQSLTQKDPNQMYRLHGSENYSKMIYKIKKDITKYVCNIRKKKN
jgi:preprotein translocase subunit SecA